MSLPTINQNIKLLKDSGLIVMEGSFDSTGGRKAQMIMVNADARFAISVNVRANELKVALIDLNGEIRSQKSVDIEFSPESDYGVKVSELVDDIIEENNINTDNILGIGITMPGIFNSDNTMIISSPPQETIRLITLRVVLSMIILYRTMQEPVHLLITGIPIRMKMLIWTSPITTNSIL